MCFQWGLECEGGRTYQVNFQRLLTIRQGPKKARFASELLLTVLTRITTVGTGSTLMHQVQMACMDPHRQYSPNR